MVLSIVTLIGDKELRDDTVLGVTLSCQFFFTYIVGFFIFECCLLLFTETVCLLLLLLLCLLRY